jgi:hypothetical protein
MAIQGHPNRCPLHTHSFDSISESSSGVITYTVKGCPYISVKSAIKKAIKAPLELQEARPLKGIKRRKSEKSATFATTRSPSTPHLPNHPA